MNRFRFASALAAGALLVPVTRGDDCVQNSWVALGGAKPGTNGLPVLTGTGSLTAGCPIALALTSACPNAPAFLVIGLSNLSSPFMGGLLVPSPDVVLPALMTDAQGAVTLSTWFPLGVPGGVDLYFQHWIADPLATLGYAASNGTKATSGTGPETGTFPASWFAGLPSCTGQPEMQIHAYNPDLYFLRQSICTNYEAPFITLIFGDTKVLMLDTGAGGIQIYNHVKGVIDAWLLAAGKPSIQLIVAHLHAHGDHVAGDSQFQGKPNTTVVGTGLTAVKNFFGITTWPTQIVAYDLGGGRVVDVIPIPGHQTAHIAVYDRKTALLFTGDSLYPGRLYIFGAVSQGQFTVYKASMQRLVDFMANRELTHIVGTHIEMSTTPFVDFPIGSTTHPNEHVLELGRAHLLELDAALDAMGTTPVYEAHAEFIIYPIG